ncbi:Asp-tRNA(Asn)/Glu-tRNA(Gln) amidotransferase subunit GatC [Geothrix sp. PMB-07]|uniref:Asp-tRNA(Asn)/Glu-tRNA(Gln) amidotransferase subunit GatC n=1 Tax=Geothrix sp. PMB-07 TaxID=3068640 RepID=UPI0027419789|nr:Asp-tRNA(Asn)/Glu-tRNA(Gln) amidotransferase subunit GatC [Geothrix sp. PMB-07]WLT32902.1 Asp-tRNA(Asn)/Glu-tRNA(Gln) amidotransferase subunit GatC [Geothrix sp. PMB-07]
MEVTRADVLRCAALTQLSLQEEEIEPMRRAMERMLTHAASLDELPLDQVEPMLAGLGRPLPRREDIPRDTFTQAQALANAPAQDRGYFVVPKVL